MDLSRLDRNSLEDVLCELMDELDVSNMELANKYNHKLLEKIYGIDMMEATDMVKKMLPYGEVYLVEDVENLLKTHGVNANEGKTLMHYYLCMNMFNNDFRRYPESKRLDVRDFCYSMSEMFINDEDAPTYKVEKYFKEVMAD